MGADKWDDKADISVRSKLGSQAGPRSKDTGPMVEDGGSRKCGDCGAVYSESTGCPMC